MESKKYRVEVFITPQNNICEKPLDLEKDINTNYINELHLNIINEDEECEMNDENNSFDNDSVSKSLTHKNTELNNCNNLMEEDEFKALPTIPDEFFENSNNSTNNDNCEEKQYNCTEHYKCHGYTEDHIYDEPFVGNLNIKKERSLLQNKIKNLRYSQRYLPRPPKRTTSLKSIDESMEILEQTFQDICYHGHKNGCTATVQQPEEVSQEIFKENWLQKLETLRQREALLRDKEVALQSQERLLFKKERQLRILERLVKDKMKQAELYLKRCKQLPGFENLLDIERSSESGFSHSSKGSKFSKSENGNEIKDNDEIKRVDLHIYDEINMKNPPNSRSSLVTAFSENTKQSTAINSQWVRSSKFSMHNSFRYKQRPKVSYEDLDSTLSADIGDSSFGVTATKFNPDVFKKPIAFQRSVSERKTTFCTNKPNSTVTQSYVDHGFKETQILKKFSENIMVSQNKDTKFQNYGLIDNGRNINSNDIRPKSANDIESNNPKKHSYTSLNKDGKDTKSVKRSKNRPISWNAENDDWLQKKRHEYNMSMRRMPVINKENQQVQMKIEEPDKLTKKEKKESKSRKFMIFR